jgi:GTPase
MAMPTPPQPVAQAPPVFPARRERTTAEKAILAALEQRAPHSASTDPRLTAEESMAELSALVTTAGVETSATLIQFRDRAEAATLLGEGKVEELRTLVELHDADVVIFDSDLSPTQQRNLERITGTRVIDRTQVILDIFASRARTREGKLQVELAQLQYLRPRLTGHGVSMSRTGAGIGTRGPGETKLENDRRRIGLRIAKIEADLRRVIAGRGIQRRQRQNVPLSTIALAGYTNAGKSTLFNRLSASSVTADSRLFATLDPTVRHLVLPTRRKVLLSDTVGFIRNLPPTLVKAFRATLEEVREATLILHVMDASSPHARQQYMEVRKVLTEIGAEETPCIHVFNKADRLDGDVSAPALLQRIADTSGAPAAVVSALTGEGMDTLLRSMDEALAADAVAACELRIPAGDGRALHEAHEFAQVLSSELVEDTWVLNVMAPTSLRQRLAHYVSTSLLS